MRPPSPLPPSRPRANPGPRRERAGAIPRGPASPSLRRALRRILARKWWFIPHPKNPDCFKVRREGAVTYLLAFTVEADATKEAKAAGLLDAEGECWLLEFDPAEALDWAETFGENFKLRFRCEGLDFSPAELRARMATSRGGAH